MTRETEKALVIIYSEYLRRRSFGTAKNQAVRFEASKLKAIDAFSNWNANDIGYCMRELSKSKYIRYDILGDVILTDQGIDYIESKPREYFSSFSNIIHDLINLVASFLSI